MVVLAKSLFLPVNVIMETVAESPLKVTVFLKTTVIDHKLPSSTSGKKIYKLNYNIKTSALQDFHLRCNCEITINSHPVPLTENVSCAKILQSRHLNLV